MTLAVSAAKVRRLIDCAERLESVGETLSTPSAGARDRATALGMYFESPTRHALHRFMAGLTASERRDLVALMMLGRGDQGAGPEDWPALRAVAGRHGVEPDVLALVGRNRLSHYLRDGLDAMERVADHNIDN